MKRNILSGFLVLFFMALTAIAFTQRQWIRDSYIVFTAEQQAASIDIMSEIDLTEQGEFLYKASQPLIQDADAFSSSCSDVSHEHSIVLGCYTRQRVYVYDVQDERLDGVKQVTAAHELLHAAYERLPLSERQELGTLLRETADSIEAERFKDTVAEYRQASPAQLENELHSILGTEIGVLPERLERHYSKYFQDRSKIVQFAQRYEATFTELDGKIKQYDAELQSLRTQKDTLDGTLRSQQTAIEQLNSELDQLRRSDPTRYNQMVPSYNAEVRAYNSNIAKLKTIISEYNELVEKRNQLATTHNDLVQQLDSHYKEY